MFIHTALDTKLLNYIIISALLPLSFLDPQEAPHQVLWAKRLGERLVRGTEA